MENVNFIFKFIPSSYMKNLLENVVKLKINGLGQTPLTAGGLLTPVDKLTALVTGKVRTSVFWLAGKGDCSVCRILRE